MIVNSGELLVTVVNDVLDYSKLESGNVDIEMSRTNLQEALESTVHSIATKAQTKNINLKTVYDYKLPKYIECDERRLQVRYWDGRFCFVRTKHSHISSSIYLIMYGTASSIQPHGERIEV